MPLWRSMLFVPAHNERMLSRATASAADAIVLDLEDAVPPGEKKSARRLARTAVTRVAREGRSVSVRINAAATGLARDDLMAVVRKGLAGIVVPKVEHPQHLRDVDVLLREAEVANKVRPGDTAMIPLIESPLAVLRCEDIARSVDRIVALSAGGEDYSAALGVPRSAAALAHMRGVIVTVAAALGIAAIDTPFPDYEDAKELAAEAALVRSMGFTGKYAIHPGQLAAINRAFTPTREQVATARAVIAAADAAGNNGAIGVAGAMVDAPVIAQARRVVETADAIRAARNR